MSVPSIRRAKINRAAQTEGGHRGEVTMGSVIGAPALDEALVEAKALLRIDGTGEDGVLTRLIGNATGLCEAFVGQWLMVREGREKIAPRAEWQRLSATPVRAILGLEGLSLDGDPAPLDPGAYAVDIDASGDGWTRIEDAGDVGMVQVHFEAGLATGDHWDDLPEPLRQGVLRLVAHLYGQRMSASGAGMEPPAAVTALWRPWRRLRLA